MRIFQDFLNNSIAIGMTAAGITVLLNMIFALGIGVGIIEILLFLGHRSKGQP